MGFGGDRGAAVLALVPPPWGRMLKGIREDETRSVRSASPVTRYKMESLILGGLFGA